MSEILKQYRAMAATGGAFRGLTVLQHADTIKLLVDKHKVTTLLDYGSGAGDAYDKPHQLHKRLGIPWPTLYDPAFQKLRNVPTRMHHGVICSDVLEHVREEDVRKLVAALFAFAERFVFASVCCRLASKTFPDGTNLHITIKPYDWWFALFEEMEPKDRTVDWVLVETP